MRRVKGCINNACVANQKKITYKIDDDFCSKCGNKLYYVCKKCYTQLPDDYSKKYCMRCLAEKHDNQHEWKKAGSVALAVAPFALGFGKKFLKVISKLK